MSQWENSSERTSGRIDRRDHRRWLRYRRAIALGYAIEGAKVVVLDSNAETGEETATAIKTGDGEAWSFRLDVSQGDACRALAAGIADRLGRVSILLNPFTAEAAAVIKDWQDIMAINLNGVFNVTHAFVQQLRLNKGRIINIGSIQSFVHARTPNSPAYTSSKHGVLGLTRALAAMAATLASATRCVQSLDVSSQKAVDNGQGPHWPAFARQLGLPRNRSGSASVL